MHRSRHVSSTITMCLSILITNIDPLNQLSKYPPSLSPYWFIGMACNGRWQHWLRLKKWNRRRDLRCIKWLCGTPPA